MNKDLLFTVTERELKRLLEVKYAIAKDDTRPILTGVYFNCNNNILDVVALDGYRLSKKELNINNNNNRFNFILAEESIKEIHKIIKKTDNTINVYMNSDDAVEFEIISQNKVITCNTLKGNYVNYNYIIPEEQDLKIKTNPKEIFKNIEIIKKLNARLVKLIITDNNITMSAQPYKEVYNEELSIKRQQDRQSLYDEEYKIKHDKWIEKVNKAKKKGKDIKTKEPVKRIAKFSKYYDIIKLDEIIYNIDCITDWSNKSDKELIIGFNPYYLYEALNLYKNEKEIGISFQNSVNPCVITKDNKNLELVLPVRLLQ